MKREKKVVAYIEDDGHLEMCIDFEFGGEYPDPEYHRIFLNLQPHGLVNESNLEGAPQR